MTRGRVGEDDRRNLTQHVFLLFPWSPYPTSLYTGVFLCERATVCMVKLIRYKKPRLQPTFAVSDHGCSETGFKI